MIKENVIIKKDIENNWNKAKNFIPKDGEIIIYSDYAAGLKIGDGITHLNDLPFLHNYNYLLNDDTLEIIESGG